MSHWIVSWALSFLFLSMIIFMVSSQDLLSTISFINLSIKIQFMNFIMSFHLGDYHFCSFFAEALKSVLYDKWQATMLKMGKSTSFVLWVRFGTEMKYSSCIKGSLKTFQFSYVFWFYPCHWQVLNIFSISEFETRHRLWNQNTRE